MPGKEFASEATPADPGASLPRNSFQPLAASNCCNNNLELRTEKLIQSGPADDQALCNSGYVVLIWPFSPLG